VSDTPGPTGEEAEADEPIRVFIVDDHGIVRRGVRSYLAIYDDIEVVGEAANGRQALERLRAKVAEGEPPDVVLMDLAMEPMDGVEATREVLAMMPDVEVVAVTSMIDQSRVQAALEAGASGYRARGAGAGDPRRPPWRGTPRRRGRPTVGGLLAAIGWAV
jgi:DNA-binding NarL/FixJ family response regulator